MSKKLFEKISERILPLKINNIIWYKNTDLIIVICENYFELQRISFKHEIILKKEEKKKIFKILILDYKETIIVILIDGSYEIINVNTGEILFSGLNINNNIQLEKEKIIIDEINFNINNNNKNFNNVPFNDTLNFNSFSKIDVSKVNFFNGKFKYNNFYLFNKENNSLQIYQKLINIICEFNFNNNNNKIINILPFNNKLLSIDFNNNNYNFNLIDIKNILNKNVNDLIYVINFSLHIFEYLKNLLNLIRKIISKLNSILFDKFLDSNNLTFKIDENNKNEYEKNFNNDLKKLYFFGFISNEIKNLFNKDLFESKNIIKFDETIHFNLKNIQDILIENIKPVLNRLSVYFNLIFCNGNLFNVEIVKNFNFYFRELYINFDKFLECLLNENFEFRNFLIWINSFNNKENNPNFQNQNNNNNYLNNLFVDYNKIRKFINEFKYNMNDINDFINKENNNNNKINNNNNNENNNENIENNFNFINNKNKLLEKYLKSNNINNNNNNKINEKVKKTLFIENINNKTNTKSIYNLIDILEENLKKINIEFTKYFSSKIILSNFFTLKNIQSIQNFSIIENDFHENIFIFTNNINNNNILYLILCNNNNQFKLSKINLTYEGISILDFKITKQNELILLVKTIKNEIKYTLILSELTNYNFIDLISNNNENLEFNLNENENISDIKIDTFADIECSDNSFIEIGERRLISLVNNNINKITIIELVNNNKN